MDGQNFQNGSEQNNSQNNDNNYYGSSNSYSNVYGAEPAADQSSNSYQDYTAQYSDPLYTTGSSYNTNNTYGNNNYSNNNYGGEYNNGSSNMYTNNAEIYGNDPVAAETKTPGTAIASLILGISGLLLDCCCGIGALFGIIGLILGIVGSKDKKSSVGTAGIICSAIALVIGILMIIYFFIFAGMSYMEDMM